MAITVIAKVKVKPGSESQFQSAADKMLAHVRENEPDTLTYLLHRAQGDPTEFVFYEVYADQAALAAHGSSPAMQEFFAAIGGIVAGRPEISLYEELGGKR
jgi:quinol monooxygenase YgiN